MSLPSPPRRILMIDDEEDIQTIARLGLTLTANWDVKTVSSGRAGLVEAQRYLPDAILLDVMMPDMDGIDTLKALQQIEEIAHIPVVFLTAKLQATTQKQLYALGARGIIHKPFDPTTLYSQIGGFLGWSVG